MEIHKHPHHVTHSKKWGEYLLEFLMLFLAVFLGFIAENIREKISESSKANEMAKSLFKEAYNDSLNVLKFIQMRERKELALENFRLYIKDNDLNHLPIYFNREFCWSFLMTTPILFEPSDAILNQLRNSGTINYFRHSNLQEKIEQLSVDIVKLRDRQQQEYTYIANYGRPFILKYFDFDWMDSITRHGTISNVEALNIINPASPTGVLLNKDQFDKKSAQNISYYYLMMLRSTRQIQLKQYVSDVNELLKLLRNEYNIEN